MRWRSVVLIGVVLASSCSGSGTKRSAAVPATELPTTTSTTPTTAATTTTAPPAPSTTPSTGNVAHPTSSSTRAARPSPPSLASPSPGGTLHYTANEDGAYALAASVGYNVHDTGTDRDTIDSLPGGGRALVWLGEKCPSGLSSSFTSAVDALGHDPHVLGYYLSDEPDPGACPGGPAGVAAEADYIHARAPGQRSFVVVDDTPGAWAAYAPAHSHADLIGLDPYPCRTDTGRCDYSMIDTAVNRAQAAGIPKAIMVPTFQDFGGASSWFMPSPDQLRAILGRWAALVPNPVMEYSYSWGCQSGSLSDCLATRPDARQVMAAHNRTG
jgi:hypothetical protein